MIPLGQLQIPTMNGPQANGLNYRKGKQMLIKGL